MQFVNVPMRHEVHDRRALQVSAFRTCMITGCPHSTVICVVNTPCGSAGSALTQGRLPHHQLRGELDLAVGVRLRRLAPPPRPAARPPCGRAGAAAGAPRSAAPSRPRRTRCRRSRRSRRRPGREALPGQLLQQPQRQQVVRAERRRRPAGGRQAGQPLPGPPPLGDVERRRPQHGQRRRVAPGVLQRLARARRAGPRPGRAPAGPPTNPMPLVARSRAGGSPPGSRRGRRPPTPSTRPARPTRSTSTTGMPRPRSSGSRLPVAVDGRDRGRPGPAAPAAGRGSRPRGRRRRRCCRGTPPSRSSRAASSTPRATSVKNGLAASSTR